MFTFFMIKELLIATPLMLTPLATQEQTNQSKYNYFYNSNEMVVGNIPQPNTTQGVATKEVYSYSAPQNPTINGCFDVKQKSYMEKTAETETNIYGNQPLTESVYTNVRNILLIQYTLRENTQLDMEETKIHINYPQIPNEMLNQQWSLYKFSDRTLDESIDALFELQEQTAQQCYTSMSIIENYFTLQEDEIITTTYDYLPTDITVDISYILNEGDTAYFGIYLEMEMTQIYDPQGDYPDGLPDNAIADYTKYFNFTQFPQYTYWDITYSFDIDESNYEVIDITKLLLDIVVMPFTFISQAFGLTLFVGTAFEVNVARILFSIIAVMLIVFIVKKFVL